MERFKRLHWINKILVLVVGTFVIVSALTLFPRVLFRDGASMESSRGHSVEYVVSGTAKQASITYTNEKGWTDQKEIELPWKWSSTSNAKDGTSLYISAQNNTAEGSLKVQILLDGTIWKQKEAFGPYVVATAMGYAGDK